MNPDDTSVAQLRGAQTAAPAKPVAPFDPAPYIRTYAKDVAMLKNEPAPVSPVPVKSAPSQEAPTSTISQGVELPEVDASPVNRTDASPKQFEQEHVELEKSDSLGIFKSQSSLTESSSSETPLMPQANIGVAPVVAKNTNEDREAVLARLRAKVQGAAPSAPPPAPEPISYREPLPAPEPFIPPTPPIPARETPPPFPTEPAPIRNPIVPLERITPVPAANPSPIHTFTTDFADRIDRERASTFSVLAAEQDAATPLRVQPKAKGRKLLPVLSGIAFVLLGVGAIGSAFFFTRQNATLPTTLGVPSLIPADERVEVTGTGQELMRSIADVASQGVVLNNVVVTYVTTPNSGEETLVTVPQSGGVLVEALNLQAPDILLRNVAPESTIGVIHSGSETRTFFLLRVSSFERTFAGMLAWEPRIAEELSVLYPSYTAIVPVTASSTATSTPPVQSAASRIFTDAVVANHDVRVLRDASGRSLLLYGYRGKDTLIIARDEAAFAALIGRLTASGE